ncbi:hypothetical protein [Streptomyces sp. MMG1533]|uniref:hypothetical protein n=1 Tax=Streptomyces sp. MMG1533 TaxID=1415546 RepID=UPI000A42958B|nr:hypothetical protein [Streptomyces sp. MMG1533]
MAGESMTTAGAAVGERAFRPDARTDRLGSRGHRTESGQHRRFVAVLRDLVARRP